MEPNFIDKSFSIEVNILDFLNIFMNELEELDSKLLIANRYKVADIINKLLKNNINYYVEENEKMRNLQMKFFELLDLDTEEMYEAANLFFPKNKIDEDLMGVYREISRKLKVSEKGIKNIIKLIDNQFSRIGRYRKNYHSIYYELIIFCRDINELYEKKLMVLNRFGKSLFSLKTIMIREFNSEGYVQYKVNLEVSEDKTEYKLTLKLLEKEIEFNISLINIVGYYENGDEKSEGYPLVVYNGTPLKDIIKE